MNNDMKAADEISLFCRLNINMKHELPIRSSEMGLLIYLVTTQGEKTPNAIAKFFKVSKSMATNMVTSLARKEYLIKEPSQLDKRNIHISPTQKAVELVDKTCEEYFKSIRLLREQLGETQFQQLITLLQRSNEILLEDKQHG